MFIPENYRLSRDSTNLRIAHLYDEWEEKTSYYLGIYPGAFTDIYDQTNDTLITDFTTRNEGYYGELRVDIKGVNCPLIVQLLDSKETVLREVTITADQNVLFDYLKPSQYKVKFIHDCNGNGKWDTGKYIKDIQPEKVEYYSGEINVRSNWEMEINMILKRNDTP